MSENQGQGRAHLKAYFETDKMPTEDHFAELIDSGLNRTDDQLSVTDAGTGENSARFLGIGSVNPQSPLSVRNRTGDAKLVGLEDAAGDEAWHISVNPPGGNDGLAVVSNTNPDATLMISTNGNVGIGTHTPGEKLDVDGNVRVTGGNIELTGGHLSMAMGNLDLSTGSAGIGGDLTVNGNTGIGTDNPVERLEVDGNVRVTNGDMDLTDGDMTIAAGNLDIAAGNLNLSTGSAEIVGDLVVMGNTGVGAAPAPGIKLNVAGDIHANGNVTAQNFEGGVSWNNITDMPDSLQGFDGNIDWGNVVEKPNSLIPAGVIVMWSGSAADVPETWAICDGNNGTPNLKDRFIVSAGDNYTPGDTGGENEITLTVDQLPTHDHPHDLAVQPGGAHSHTLNNEMGGAAGSGNQFNMVDEGSQDTLDTDTAGEHIHTLSGGIGNTGGDQSHENRPPYYALVYIMKLQEELPAI